MGCSDGKDTGVYPAEIKIYANNRTGVLVDISKVLTENKIDVISMNVRTSKQGQHQCVGFEINGVEQLNEIIAKIRNGERIRYRTYSWLKWLAMSFDWTKCKQISLCEEVIMRKVNIKTLVLGMVQNNYR